MKAGSRGREVSRWALALLALSFVLEPRGPGSAAAQSVWDAASEARIYEITRSWSLAVGDFDRDGLEDVLMGRHDLAARIYHNDGGTFSEYAAGTLAADNDRHGCAWGDVDRDGLDDIYCSRGAEHGTISKANELWMHQPGGSFVDRASEYGVTDPYGRGRQVTFLDVNHDAYPDLFVGNRYPRQDERTSPNRLFINRNGESFEEVDYGVRGEVGAYCVQAADVDGDGWDDVLVCGQDELKLYRNEDGASFAEVDDSLRLAAFAVSADLVDLDEDEDLDLVSLRRRHLRVQLWRSDHFGRRIPVRDLTIGEWVVGGDVNGDGSADLYVVQACSRGVNRPDALLLNDGSGKAFSEIEVPQAETGCGDVAAMIDYDQDGWDDVLVVNGEGIKGELLVEGPVQLLTLGSGPAG